MDDKRRRAMQDITIAPAVVANVALRTAKPLVEMKLGYDQYWWGGKYWNDFVIADWLQPTRHDPDRKTIISVYSGNSAPPEDYAQRTKQGHVHSVRNLCESSLREDLARIMVPGAASTSTKTSRPCTWYRWGHALVYPKVELHLRQDRGGTAQHPTRTPAPRHLARGPPWDPSVLARPGYRRHTLYRMRHRLPKHRACERVVALHRLTTPTSVTVT